MLDYTTFRIAQHEYRELSQPRPAAEGIRIETAGPLRRGLAGLGGLLVAVGHRLQGPVGPVGAQSAVVSSGD